MKNLATAGYLLLTLSIMPGEAIACGTVKKFAGMYFATDDPVVQLTALKSLRCVTPLRVYFKKWRTNGCSG